MNKQIEITNKISSAEQAIEKLDVLAEQVEDPAVKDIIIETILRLHICLNQWYEDLYDEQGNNLIN